MLAFQVLTPASPATHPRSDPQNLPGMPGAAGGSEESKDGDAPIPKRSMSGRTPASGEGSGKGASSSRLATTSAT